LKGILTCQRKLFGYEEKKYEQKDFLYDSLAQAFANYKYEYSSSGVWDKLGIHGVSFKMLDATHFSLTCHMIDIGTEQDLYRHKDDGIKFIKEIEKELKKKFKQLTKKNISFKKEKDDYSVEKFSVLDMYSTRPVGKFLVRTSIVYSVE